MHIITVVLYITSRSIAKPLSDLPKKGQEFIWGNRQQKAFETLKEKLCSEPILRAPNYQKSSSNPQQIRPILESRPLKQLDENKKIMSLLMHLDYSESRNYLVQRI